MCEGVAMKPTEFDLYLGSNPAETRAGHVVALDAPCQRPGLRFDHGDMFVDIHDAGCGGRVAIGTSHACDDGLLKREQITFMKRGAVIGLHVSPNSQAYQRKAQRHENRTELLGIGNSQPPHGTQRAHRDQQADDAEGEKDEGSTKIHD